MPNREQRTEPVRTGRFRQRARTRAPGQDLGRGQRLVFANLTGSITGLDHIGNLSAGGWLGTEDTQQVWSNTGIDHLAAYGIGATVIADRSYLASDSSSVVTIGDGGITGTLEAGNLASLNSRGKRACRQGRIACRDLRTAGTWEH